jgi:putative phosphoribosyl transferase
LTAINARAADTLHNGGMYFHDRHDAGRQLAKALTRYRDQPDGLVLGLPRGGALVAYEVAHALRLPMDLMIVRKLGAPGHAELAIGAIGEGGHAILNQDVIKSLGVTEAAIRQIVAAETAEIARRVQLYRHGAPTPSLTGRTVILVDDGCATGADMRAAVLAAAAHKPKRLVVAVPVVSGPAHNLLVQSAPFTAYEVVSLAAPSPFYSVGQYYGDFHQCSDQEVLDLMIEARKEQHHD